MDVRKIFVAAVLCLVSATSFAQVVVADDYYLGDRIRNWNAITYSGPAMWQPEITYRGVGSFFTSGKALGVGVKVNSRRSYGIRVGQFAHHVDALPGDYYTYTFGVYTRRNIYLGPRRAFSLYSDLSAGAETTYKATGDNIDRYATVGEVMPYVSWEPGFKLRVFRNLHVFMGPTIATSCIGIHAGIGL